MKKLFLILSVFGAVLYSCSGSPKGVVEKTEHILGNCEKCKATIDKAAKIQGVSEASWNKDSKLITIKLDTNVTSVKSVLKAIAAAGYDSDLYHGDDYAYAKLPLSCQYERKIFTEELSK